MFVFAIIKTHQQGRAVNFVTCHRACAGGSSDTAVGAREKPISPCRPVCDSVFFLPFLFRQKEMGSSSDETKKERTYQNGRSRTPAPTEQTENNIVGATIASPVFGIIQNPNERFVNRPYKRGFGFLDIKKQTNATVCSNDTRRHFSFVDYR